ncbi:glycolipid transfer protein-like [Clavelina lepadiformis]|uniref:glycolipid transfer protein-like n=1 Tax=Clavelina lepadiformis TaxID=159417 RepID=UPI004042D2B3
MPCLFVPGFPDIPEDKKIDTIKFIEACEKIPSIFDLLGGKIFSPVKNDVIGNIEKIKKRYLENPVKFATLDDIIEVERHETDKKLKAKDGNGLATNALMWLKRGLKFILLFLEHLLKNDYDSNPENLKSCAKLAYKGSLQEYHGFIVSQLVSAATNACPYRSDFLKALALREGLNEEETLESARVFSINFRATVDTVYELFDKTGVEKFHKV